MLAIDFAKLKININIILNSLLLTCSSTCFPSVPKPCASSTSKRKLYFFASSQQSLSIYLVVPRIPKTPSVMNKIPPPFSANL
jgi:hypothetical protein